MNQKKDNVQEPKIARFRKASNLSAEKKAFQEAKPGKQYNLRSSSRLRESKVLSPKSVSDKDKKIPPAFTRIPKSDVIDGNIKSKRGNKKEVSENYTVSEEKAAYSNSPEKLSSHITQNKPKTVSEKSNSNEVRKITGIVKKSNYENKSSCKIQNKRRLSFSCGLNSIGEKNDEDLKPEHSISDGEKSMTYDITPRDKITVKKSDAPKNMTTSNSNVFNDAICNKKDHANCLTEEINIPRHTDVRDYDGFETHCPKTSTPVKELLLEQQSKKDIRRNGNFSHGIKNFKNGGLRSVIRSYDLNDDFLKLDKTKTCPFVSPAPNSNIDNSSSALSSNSVQGSEHGSGENSSGSAALLDSNNSSSTKTRAREKDKSSAQQTIKASIVHTDDKDNSDNRHSVKREVNDRVEYLKREFLSEIKKKRSHSRFYSESNKGLLSERFQMLAHKAAKNNFWSPTTSQFRKSTHHLRETTHQNISNVALNECGTPVNYKSSANYQTPQPVKMKFPFRAPSAPPCLGKSKRKVADCVRFSDDCLSKIPRVSPNKMSDMKTMEHEQQRPKMQVNVSTESQFEFRDSEECCNDFSDKLPGLVECTNSVLDFQTGGDRPSASMSDLEDELLKEDILQAISNNNSASTMFELFVDRDLSYLSMRRNIGDTENDTKVMDIHDSNYEEHDHSTDEKRGENNSCKLKKPGQKEISKERKPSFLEQNCKYVIVSIIFASICLVWTGIELFHRLIKHG